MDQNDQSMVGKKCPCPHHKVIPLFIVVLGLVFLLNAFAVVSSRFTEIIWPIIVILIGLQKMFETRCSCCSRM